MAAGGYHTLEVELCTDLIHTIISETATHGIFINWRHSNGIPLDRSIPRRAVSSKKAYDIICALGYKSPAYQHFVMSVVNHMRHQQFILVTQGPSLSQLHQMGGVPWEFSEDILMHVYNLIQEGQLQVMQMVSYMAGTSKNVKLG